ncbi:AbrB family transcriptional regulator [Dyella amyloliquefaciens]|uniref:AbrB family transcriptional regulator n=1 Tax=Dyella amyloliquefaciens TaxID=1770545 RepID=UPI00102E3A0B|nr:AbrB family transcriptional regulator [Dyella amyloliquefaciens]
MSPPLPGWSLRALGPVPVWTLLLLLSTALAGALLALHLTAALLIGPMAAAIVLAALDARIEVGNVAFMGAQALVGCMIARSFSPALLHEAAREWPLFLVGVASVIGVAVALGWVLAKRRVLPGTTAVWGSFPGAATAMALMAEAFGADVRLVAFMQYLRVLMVAVVASTVARVSLGSAHAPPTAWLAAVPLLPFLTTLLLAFGSAAIAYRLRIPAGPLLLPLFVGALAQDMGWLKVTLPAWLLAISYAVIGWGIGQRFTRDILGYALKVMPRILGAILALIAICAGLSALLMMVSHKDALTAYLAMSPGGADSVAIIAASSQVDVPFVMAMQSARFLLVVLLGPGIARWVAARVQVAGQD